MKRYRLLAWALVICLLVALVPTSAMASASCLSLNASFSPSTLSGPGNVRYKWTLVNCGAYTVSNISIIADGSVIGGVASLPAGAAVGDNGTVYMNANDIGRYIKFQARGYASVPAPIPVIGGGLPGMTSNTGPAGVPVIGGGASSNTETVTASCNAKVDWANVPQIPQIPQPVPVIPQIQQPLPVIQQIVSVKASAAIKNKVVAAGSTDKLTVSVRNQGNTDITNVRVLINNSQVTSTKRVAAGTRENLVYNLPVNEAMSFKPTLVYTDYTGRDVAQNLDKIKISVSKPDIELSVMSSSLTPNVNEDVAFAVTVKNAGSGTVKNLKLYDYMHNEIALPLTTLKSGDSTSVALSERFTEQTDVTFYAEGSGNAAATSETLTITPALDAGDVGLSLNVKPNKTWLSGNGSDMITFNCIVTNDGEYDLSSVMISTDALGVFGVQPTLEAGASIAFKCSIKLTGATKVLFKVTAADEMGGQHTCEAGADIGEGSNFRPQ